MREIPSVPRSPTSSCPRVYILFSSLPEHPLCSRHSNTAVSIHWVLIRLRESQTLSTFYRGRQGSSEGPSDLPKVTKPDSAWAGL